MELISDFCRRNQLILAVDAVSSFLADPFWMGKWGVDLVLTGSQKALAPSAGTLDSGAGGACDRESAGDGGPLDVF